MALKSSPMRDRELASALAHALTHTYTATYGVQKMISRPVAIGKAHLLALLFFYDSPIRIIHYCNKTLNWRTEHLVYDKMRSNSNAMSVVLGGATDKNQCASSIY